MATETKIPTSDLLKNLEEAKKVLDEAKRKFTEARLAVVKRRKKKKEQLRKTTEMDDLTLVEKTRTWHACFMDHEAEFLAFDPGLNLGVIWTVKADELEAFPTDETTMDEVQEKTDALEKKIADVLKLCDDLEYFVSRAFPNQERKMQEFAFDKLRTSVANYVGYLALNVLTNVLLVNDYATELTAVGMPANFADTLEDAVGDMALAESQQEYMKRLRIRRTTQRIKMFNDLFSLHQTVKKAAKVIFHDNEVVARKFE